MLSMLCGTRMNGVRTRIACGLVCVLFGSAVVNAQQQARSTQEQQGTRTAGSSIVVNSEDIVRNPSQFYGKLVMIQPDDVDRVISPHAFLLDEDAALAGPDLLVLVPSPSRTIAREEDVIVTGTVRRYVRAEIERDYDWFDADGWKSTSKAGR